MTVGCGHRRSAGVLLRLDVDRRPIDTPINNNRQFPLTGDLHFVERGAPGRFLAHGRHRRSSIVGMDRRSIQNLGVA